MKIRNINQARNRARELFGKAAVLQKRKPTKLCGAYAVGKQLAPFIVEVYGSGDSWDEAFAQAEARLNGEV